jgi:7-keto-8-aminopelargonate synthetase-like enzyme
MRLRYPAPTFYSLTALPFDSDFDGNMGLFACVPLAGDTLLYNNAIHALVHDRNGYPASHRIARVTYLHA